MVEPWFRARSRPRTVERYGQGHAGDSGYLTNDEACVRMRDMKARHTPTVRPRSPDFNFVHLDDGMDWFKVVSENNPTGRNNRSFEETKGKPLFNPVGHGHGRRLWFFWDGKVETNAAALLNKRRNRLAYL